MGIDFNHLLLDQEVSPPGYVDILLILKSPSQLGSWLNCPAQHIDVLFNLMLEKEARTREALRGRNFVG
jgi:hypothetical protein